MRHNWFVLLAILYLCGHVCRDITFAIYTTRITHHGFNGYLKNDSQIGSITDALVYRNRDTAMSHSQTTKKSTSSRVYVIMHQNMAICKIPMVHGSAYSAHDN